MTKPKHPHPHSETKKHILHRLHILQVALAIVVALLLAAGVTIWQIHEEENHRQELHDEAMHPTNSIGGPFALTDQDGKTVHDTDFHGKYMLVYFGYTYCPDMCPTGLEGIAHVLDQLGSDSTKVQPIFITIDPARDTPAKLKDYAASFHQKIVALTGTPEQIAAVAAAYQVFYAKGDDVDDGDYLMDHSTLIYVMDPNGKFVTTFPDDTSPAAMTEALKALWSKPKKS